VIAAAVVFLYLALVLYIGIFAFRRGTAKAEDFFLANRSLGTFVFLLSLFGSNMTSFAILGSSGLAFRSGIMVYGLMASISGIVIPLSIFFIGTRIWAIGKKFGHMTQVQIFRDRWEMGHIGTAIFVLQALMLVPYIIIGVMGGGETLEGVSNGAVPYWIGGLQLQWNPFDWGRAAHDRESLVLERDVVIAEAQAFADALRRATTRDLATIDRLERVLAADDEIVVLREQIVRETMARFRESTITASELVDRETDLLSARIARGLHRVELAQARASYLTTLGLQVN